MPALEGDRALLEVRDLSVVYDCTGEPCPAVHDLTFQLAPEEILGVVGPSGCGKTSMALALLRLLPRTAQVNGSARYGDRELLSLPESELRRIRGREIAIVYQEPGLALNPVRRVGDQIAEVLRAHLPLSRAERKHRVENILQRVDLDPKRYYGAYPHELSGGERHRVVLAQALICNPALVIADEPTAGLDPILKQEILNLIETLHRQLGTAFLLISHDRGVIERLADRVLEMGSPRQQAQPRRYVCASFSHITNTAQHENKVVLAARNVTKRYTARGVFRRAQAEKLALDNVDLTIFSAEILGLIGASGAGKSTLGRCLAMLETADSGELLLGNINVLKLHRRNLREYRPLVQYIAQDAAEALNPRLTAREAVEEPLFIRGAGAADRRRRVSAILERVELDPAAADRSCQEFSGGQKQRLVIARALTLEPKVLIFDESLSGLDPETRSDILTLMRRLKSESGIAQIVITHDMDVAAECADRVAVMRHGRIAQVCAARDIAKHFESCGAGSPIESAWVPDLAMTVGQ